MLFDEDLDNPTILIFITEATPPSRSGTVPRFDGVSEYRAVSGCCICCRYRCLAVTVCRHIVPVARSRLIVPVARGRLSASTSRCQHVTRGSLCRQQYPLS